MPHDHRGVSRLQVVGAPFTIIVVLQIVGLVSMTTAGAVFNQPSFGILPTLGEMASVKFYQDTLGLFVDRPNKFHFDDPWLGFGGSELFGPFGRVGINSQH
jgi:hypothetical protein